MKKNLIGIIGAGYQATETALYLRSSGYEILFFADELVSREEVHDKEGIRYINISEIPRDSKIITAVGDSNLRKKLVAQIGNIYTNCIMQKM